VPPVVQVEHLSKRYGDVDAVRDASFAIEPGECVALLGPNGAGKTTTVEILEGYRPRDRGRVEVLGIDPARADRSFRERVGIVLQHSGTYRVLTVTEVLRLHHDLYPSPRPVDEVLGLVGLDDKAGARTRTLSGGQQRRLDLALGLIGDPELLFLDEPTTGFDPSARRRSWDLVDRLRRLGKTILLTTHYMDEAHGLADRLAILREGAIVATGSPRELLAGHADVEIRFRRNGREVVIDTDEPTRVLHELTTEALAAGSELEGLEVHRRSLEDVYLELTREEEA
jgi:ABC-2 type transport system ATP-binding protein